jgi:hypothetical protein
VKILPEDYVVTKFYQFVGGPTKNKYNNTYQGSCPMCREGSSWLKKKRFYFIPQKNVLFCHNCGYSKSPINWISEICNLTFTEILKEINESNIDILSYEEEKPKFVVDTLPKDCINLLDENQVKFYKNNQIVKKALQFLSDRFLLNSINKPKTFYLSLTDKIHKNRIVIPFFDENGKVVHYQSRTILESDTLVRPRYLSKLNSEKTIFNIDRVDPSYDTIFIFEGPLNSCFVKNGIAVGGIQENSYQLFTSRQEEQMIKYPFHKKIWVLDSQWKDKAAFIKTKKLLDLKESVFIWPENIGKKFKDFNDVIISIKDNHISPDFIKKYTKS